MANILVQTTLCDGEGESQIDRFSSLITLLRSDGHGVVARNRAPQFDGSDPVLSTLDASDFDELWILAADRGNGLAPADVRGILRFRERGGGIFTCRDNESAGLSLLNLGSVGLVHEFRKYNRAMSRRIVFGGPCARLIPLWDVAYAIDGERSEDGRPYGRAVAFHRPTDGQAGLFEDLARDIARWLAPAS